MVAMNDKSFESTNNRLKCSHYSVNYVDTVEPFKSEPRKSGANKIFFLNLLFSC